VVEESLKHSESRLPAAFSQSYSFLVLLEPDGTIIEANRAALDAAGSGSSEVVGRNFWELWWSPLPDEGAPSRSSSQKLQVGIQFAKNALSACPIKTRAN
jgi:PAS domain S-box-containing protein